MPPESCGRRAFLELARARSARTAGGRARGRPSARRRGSRGRGTRCRERVRQGISRSCCGMSAHRASRSAATWRTRSRSCPSSGSSRPAMSERSVDLPHPLGPTMPRRDASRIDRSMPSSATTSPNVCRTPRISIEASADLRAAAVRRRRSDSPAMAYRYDGSERHHWLGGRDSLGQGALIYEIRVEYASPSLAA